MVELKSERFPLLLSYAHIKEWPDSEIDWALSNPDVDVFLDSGAFTVYQKGEVIPIEQYCAFLDKWKDKLWGYIALDVVGNPEGTMKNLEYMWANGYEPVPVHVDGAKEDNMDYLFAHSNLICTAGLPLSYRMTSKNMSYMKLKMKWAKKRPVHWLGYTHEGMIQGFRPYSVDSSSWSSSLRYGNAMIYLGSGRKLMVTTDEVRKGNLGDKQEQVFAQLRRFGIEPADFMDISRWTGIKFNNKAYLASSMSWVAYVRELQQRFSTRYFIAIVVSVQVSALYWVLNRINKTKYPILKNLFTKGGKWLVDKNEEELCLR